MPPPASAGTPPSDHWAFFQLPPFFTQQPAAATLERQTSLWASLLLDHASYHARQSKTGTCAVLRYYSSTSDIFQNAKTNRRLAPEGAATMLEALVRLHPNHAVVVSNGGPEDFSVLVATTVGGLKELEQSLLSWILEMGQGTTTAMLAKKGVVMTFDELAESKCLQYKLSKLAFLTRTSDEPVPVGDVGALGEEQAIRCFLQALNHRPVSVMQPFKITLFNMDGSSKQPYEGVKFGGE